MKYYFVAMDKSYDFDLPHWNCYLSKRIISIISSYHNSDHLCHHRNFYNLETVKCNLSKLSGNSWLLFHTLSTYHLISIIYQNCLLNSVLNKYLIYFYFQMCYFVKIFISLYSFSFKGIITNSFSNFLGTLNIFACLNLFYLNELFSMEHIFSLYLDLLIFMHSFESF